MGKNRKAAACGAMPAMRAWMHEIRETLYDFSQIVEEDALSRHYSDVLQAQEQVLSTGLDQDSASSGNSVTGNMVENGLPGGMSDEQLLWANSDNQESNVMLWYTDQVRKWYGYADVS